MLADGFDGPSAVSGVLRDILQGDRQTEFVIFDTVDGPEEPGVVERETLDFLALGVVFAVPVRREFMKRVAQSK